MSRTEVVGRPVCSGCQESPSSNDTKAPRSVPANSSPRRTGSSRTTFAEFGRPLFGSVVRRWLVDGRRNAGIGARQIRADGLPCPAFVRRPPDPLVAEIKRMLAPAPGQWERPFAAVLVGESERRIDVARLPGLEVEPVDPPAVDHVGIERVRRDFVGFAARGDLMKLRDVDPVILAVG